MRRLHRPLLLRAKPPPGLDPVLHLRMEGANASTSFIDSSRFARAVTVVGNTQHSTADQPFGTSAALFDGSGDELTLASHTDFDLGDTYTIELFAKATSLPYDNWGLVARGEYSTSSQQWTGLQFGMRWLANAANDGKLRCYFYGTSFSNEQYVDTASNPVVTSAWRHIAMVRNGTEGKVFVGGAQSGATVSGLGVPTASDRLLRVGHIFLDIAGNTNNHWFPGRMKELRIIKGRALYWENFTPPSGPL